MNKPPKDTPLKWTLWRDHGYSSGWHAVTDRTLKPILIETIGWVTAEDEETICLSQSVDVDGD